MQVGYAFTSLLRILFLRGSPERILYVRRNFVVGLFAALILSATAQYLYHQDHLVFVILRVFAELTVFMMWMVVLTGKVARLRLASAMLILVWTSALMDTILILLSGPFRLLQVSDGGYDLVAYLLGGAICYGLVSVIAWALRAKGLVGIAALHVAGYIMAVTAVDVAFRYLYGMMAAA